MPFYFKFTFYYIGKALAFERKVSCGIIHYNRLFESEIEGNTPSNTLFLVMLASLIVNWS